MARNAALVIAGFDDWWGIYKDGVLVDEGHNYRINPAARFIIDEYKLHVTELIVDGDWLQDIGRLPAYLKDVKRATQT